MEYLELIFIIDSSMQAKNFKAAVLDIDGTLTDGNSWLDLTQRLGADPSKHAQIFESFRSGQTSYAESNRQLMKLWLATGNANRQSIDHAVAGMPLRPDASALVSDLQAMGLTVLLVSGSMDAFVSSVARRLGVETFFFNAELNFDDSDQLASFTYDKEQSTRKKLQVERFCTDSGLDPSQVVVVGDSDNDMALFDLTGNGIAVNQGIGTPLKGPGLVPSVAPVTDS